MRRSGLSSFPVYAMVAVVAAPAAAQQQLTCRNGRCERVIYGTAPAAVRLKVSAHGPVTLEGGVSRDLSYVIRVTVDARSEAEARRVLQQYTARIDRQGQWTVLTAPGGPVITSVSVKAPRLSAASVITSDGKVSASGIDGPLDVDTKGGEVVIDRIQGEARLVSGGGDIQVGQVGGSLHCATGAGKISVRQVGGEATLETAGGDIFAQIAGGAVHAQTGGGGVHIGTAGGPVTAVSGGGEIVVEKANGVVTLRNMAGPVNVGSAAGGVRCDSGSGGIRLA